MAKIWANRLIAGDKTWDQVPEERKEAVRAELEKRVRSGKIRREKLEEILGGKATEQA